MGLYTWAGQRRGVLWGRSNYGENEVGYIVIHINSDIQFKLTRGAIQLFLRSFAYLLKSSKLQVVEEKTSILTQWDQHKYHKSLVYLFMSKEKSF